METDKDNNVSLNCGRREFLRRVGIVLASLFVTGAEAGGIYCHRETSTFLKEQIEKDASIIPNLIKSPPQVFLLHCGFGVVPVNISENRWAPDASGYYNIRALAELLSASLGNYSDSSPTVLTVGGHDTLQGGVPWSRIYADSMGHELKRKGKVGLSDAVRIIAEEDYGFRAIDTLGELQFLQYYLSSIMGLTNGTKPVSVVPAPQLDRVERLAGAHRIELKVVSREGVLSYFHGAKVAERFTRRFPETVPHLESFKRAELLKMLVMILDRKGLFLQNVAERMGSRWKSSFVTIE